MNSPLEDWPRDYYMKGGSSPFLLYVVFGADIDDLCISRGKYRCDSVPEGIEVISCGPDSHPEIVDSFRKGYLWDELVRKDPALADTIAAQTKCSILKGSVADDTSLNYFRNTIGLLSCFLDHGGVSVFDPQRFKWWSRSDWMSSIFEPALPQPCKHVIIIVSEENDGAQWFHTRGMKKFGRPDLSIHNVPPQYRDAVTDLFNGFIEFQAFGGIISDGQEVQLNSLPAGMYCTTGGDEDDPDFNNFHIEIRWPSASGLNSVNARIN
jgi:hypothetical protein